MALILDGTNGLSDVDGTAGTPAIRGSDANTGVFFGTDIVGVSTGGTERMRVDASGNVGIGTSSPLSILHVGGGGDANVPITIAPSSGGNAEFRNTSSTGTFTFTTTNGATERMRIDSSGNLLVGTTSNNGYEKLYVSHNNVAAGFRRSGTANQGLIEFRNDNGIVGQIATSGSSTSYVTSSDYRLKHDIQSMTGALAKVAALKPVTYKWNVDDSAGEGFIAHELQEVCPSAVTGEKDAVDAEGNPQYQGIDTSFLTATLAAALQELHQIVKDQAAEIAELKAKLP